MTPSKTAKECGTTILEMVTSTGLTRRGLTKMHEERPHIFKLIALGAACSNKR